MRPQPIERGNNRLERRGAVAAPDSTYSWPILVNPEFWVNGLLETRQFLHTPITLPLDTKSAAAVVAQKGGAFTVHPDHYSGFLPVDDDRDSKRYLS
jgi:hypothetical protein